MKKNDGNSLTKEDGKEVGNQSNISDAIALKVSSLLESNILKSAISNLNNSSITPTACAVPSGPVAVGNAASETTTNSSMVEGDVADQYSDSCDTDVSNSDFELSVPTHPSDNNPTVRLALMK